MKEEDNLPIDPIEEEQIESVEPETEEEPEYTLPDDESIPEKFRGKTPVDVVKSYTELEKMVARKAEAMANEIVRNRGTGETKAEVKDAVDEIDFTKMDFTKMSPTDFAKWIIGEVDKRSEAKARHIISQTSSNQERVRNEIAEAQEKHPHIKDNEDYREAVLAYIENATARGQDMTLEEACQKVDRLMGIVPGKTEEKKEAPKLHKRAGVERTPPQDAGDNLTEEDRVKQGMLSAGGWGRGGLGGLGI